MNAPAPDGKPFRVQIVTSKIDGNQRTSAKSPDIYSRMRRILAFLLATLIFVQAFYNLGLTVYWLANRAYIASAICENRKRPELHCDGKCYLKKRLAPSTDDAPAGTATKTPGLKKGIEVADMCRFWPARLSGATSRKSSVLIPGKQSLRGIARDCRIFHPPPLPA